MDKNNCEKQCNRRGKVGGQALIEGIMMRGLTTASMATRLPNGEIDVEVWELKKQTIWNKIPIIRGVFSFVGSLTEGYKCLSKSAEKAGIEDEEPESKFEKWLAKVCGDKITNVVMVVGVLLAVIIMVSLFIYLPSLAVQLLDKVIPLGGFKALVEGLIKIMIFIGYLIVVSYNSDIKRVYQYHGAEHKTIFCYEANLPLTVENVRKQSRFHPRCGTSFLLIIAIISILIFSLPIIGWDNLVLRSVLKIVMLPLILGIAFEFIKLAGKKDNFLVKAFSYPGLKLQHLTTREPDDAQIEVAIAAVKPCVAKIEGTSEVPIEKSHIIEVVSSTVVDEPLNEVVKSANETIMEVDSEEIVETIDESMEDIPQ